MTQARFLTAEDRPGLLQRPQSTSIRPSSPGWAPDRHLDLNRTEEIAYAYADHETAQEELLVTGTLAVALVVTTACSPSPSQTPGPGASGAPVAGQFCSGTKIVFFPGGTPGGGFETVVYNGAKAAETSLGPDGYLPVVGLGSGEDGDAAWRGNRHQPGWHRDHGPPRR